MRDRLANSGLNLSAIEQIALDRERFAAARIELRFCARELFGIARQQRDFAALLANLSRDDQAEAARAAGYESDFVAIGKASHFRKRSTLNAQRSTPNAESDGTCSPSALLN
jgi:hypothetical protein